MDIAAKSSATKENVSSSNQINDTSTSSSSRRTRTSMRR